MQQTVALVPPYTFLSNKMSVFLSFLVERHVENAMKMKIVLPKPLPDVLYEDRATPPRFTIRVVIHGDDAWHIGATAPHVVEASHKPQTHASRFLGP